MSQSFNPKATPVVGFVAENGETRKAIVNGVSEEGNPDLAVIQQVPNAPFDPHGSVGSWHYLPGTEPPAEPVGEAEPQGEEPSEPA